jgi:glycosyltransferase involved in cell wall biosynthesis
MPMKIFVDGIIFSMQPRGGISCTYAEVLQRITRQDPELEFVLYLRRKLRAERLPLATRVRILPERSIYPWRWFIDKYRVQQTFLDKAYLGSAATIFHTTYFTQPDTRRGPYVVSIYDMMDEIYAPLFQRASRKTLLARRQKCLTSADLIISNSLCTTRDLQQYYPIPDSKIHTIPLGVSEDFRPVDDQTCLQAFLKKYRLDRPFFLYVGNRASIKNFLALLKAYAGFKSRQEICLVTVGGEDTFSDEEQQCMAAARLEGAVKHIRRLTDDELVMAYNTATAFIYPSLYEGFGLPLLEAMACGTPVLASNVASIPEVAGDAALYFDPRKPDSITEMMEAVLDRDRACTLKDNGKARARLFNWDETSRLTLEAYRQLT